MPVNLSLYLVTDSTPKILGDRDLCSVVEQAVKGGVTIVQYRDKHSDTRELIETAAKLHSITLDHGIPLIINDRVDVAIAVGAEGVHLGQDDMDIYVARKMLPKGTIIGVTVSSIEEAQAAVESGADYLGIGTVHATPTKTNTKSIIGTAGVKHILNHVSSISHNVGTVAIGGINLNNAQRVIYQSQGTTKGLDGVAVVSAIMAADDPQAAAASFLEKLSQNPAFATIPITPRENEESLLLNGVNSLVRKVAIFNPLCHNMINYVVANFAANVALAIGASPIMSGYGLEAPDLAKNNGALLINMGTLNNESMDNYLQAIRAYNETGNPVVLDPVGAAATQLRRQSVKTLMQGGYFDLIKGNESEISYIYGYTGGHQVGVDSGPRCVVLLTGSTDYLSDGSRTVAIRNGHPLLGQVTGTGCAIGTITAAFLAVERHDKLLAVLSALLMFEVAAERAASNGVKGPGSFVPALLDELYSLRTQAMGSNAAPMDTIKNAAKLNFIHL
ncbi:thiamine-phosphate pyrophosphorylase [Microsporum canis CBS 113480]|uniref:Thiamine-phosphate pyrophosphorylase n=1 Tax=Arthroderma otae (strain ATCC MYA-4605 / CBS 113480) TaxID=554155 RepID=C5FNJ8_ARTOC|nr:thiamine-phosphate pyrophosphorylase [Microsporum canis CBS 113480]EEQ31612.1 thiamine-phosphate pyrophosphorylase [Microsporum canis CBS 113480]